MRIAIEISEKTIADIMTSAIEHNDMTRAWCADLSPAGGTMRAAKARKNGWWYADPETYKSGVRFDVTEVIDESKKATGTNLRVHHINGVRLRDGLALMAEKYSEHFGNMLNDNADVITADVFLQCVALGEVRYG